MQLKASALLLTFNYRWGYRKQPELEQFFDIEETQIMQPQLLDLTLVDAICANKSENFLKGD